MVKKYILFGAGERCRNLCDIIRNSDIEITDIVDNDVKKCGQIFEGYVIKSFDQLQNYTNVRYCITVASETALSEIREQIYQKKDGNFGNEISFYELLIEAYSCNKDIAKTIMGHSIGCGKKINVLFDSICGMGLGGVEKWTQDVCVEFIKRGRERTYIVTDNGRYDISTNLEPHILSVDIEKRGWFIKKTVIHLIEVIMRKLPCKVITSSTNEMMLAAYLIKQYYPNQIEIISVVHNSNKEVYARYKDFRMCPDRYVGVSEEIVRDIPRYCDVKKPISHMHIPFQCDMVLQRKYTIEDGKPLHIGYAGRIEIGQKRMDLLPDLIRILKENNIDFEMEIAGDGSYLETLKRRVSLLKLESYVKFLGKIERSQMGDFWKKQDICINLSDFEGRSISITEAMGNGAVPIVTATSGVAEDIINGESGYIVPVGDYSMIAKYIMLLYIDRKQLKFMGQRAHDIVYPKSRMETHIEFWNKILADDQ